MKIYLSLILSSLAIWRICVLFARDKGPWDIFLKLRKRYKKKFLGDLMTCIPCSSFWVSFPFALYFYITEIGYTWYEGIIIWFALSAIVSIIEIKMISVTYEE